MSKVYQVNRMSPFPNCKNRETTIYSQRGTPTSRTCVSLSEDRIQKIALRPHTREVHHSQATYAGWGYRIIARSYRVDQGPNFQEG